LDALYFGSWTIQILSLIGGSTGLMGLIGLPFAIIFGLVCGIAIRNICKFRTDVAEKQIQQRTDQYHKWRYTGIGLLAIGGIILAIVYYYAVKEFYENTGFSKDEATAFAVGRLLNTLFSYGVSILILFGYKDSLDDSSRVISMSVSGATLGAMNGGSFQFQQPIYGQNQPRFIAFVGQGTPIGGPIQPLYMPSPNQGYNPPPPIVPLQMNSSTLPAPYRPPVDHNPQLAGPSTAGIRAEGTKGNGY
jgi:hypothetical protein